MRKSRISAAVLTAICGAFLLNTTHGGTLGPQPDVLATYDREFLERFGAQTLQELLDTGIVRQFVTGGQTLHVMVNGRSYSSTGSSLETLPISAIERIELLSGFSLGTLGGASIRGALNIVLRSEFEGTEVGTVTRLPRQDGGDGFQGSLLWGGAYGEEGNITINADFHKRQQIPSRSRDFSKSTWRSGGTFRESNNISVGGNTLFTVPLSGGQITGPVKSVALGSCDTALGYTGELDTPPGTQGAANKGCGFAYANFAWNTTKRDQKSVILNFDNLIAEDTNFRLDAIVSKTDWAFRYAPSVGSFRIVPTSSLLTEINNKLTQDADSDDLFFLAHRFIGHGNRDWNLDSHSIDIAMTIEGLLSEKLGYDIQFETSRVDGDLDGDTFVLASEIRNRIQSGAYNVLNPNAASNSQAIADTSLSESNDFGSRYYSARLALEGPGFTVNNEESSWTAGIELGKLKSNWDLTFLDNQGNKHDVFDVLGSGGYSFAGERQVLSAFAESSLPLTKASEFRLATRYDELDDVGAMQSWRMGIKHQIRDNITLRSNWSIGEGAPSFRNLYSSKVQGHPYIQCNPREGALPRPPCTTTNRQQVQRITVGNPMLRPSKVSRFDIGAVYRNFPYVFGMEYFRLKYSGVVAQNSADWSMRNLAKCPDTNQSNCVEGRDGSKPIKIYDRYMNVLDNDVSGIKTEFAGGFKTGWADFSVRGRWQHLLDAERRIAGNEVRYALPKNAVRVSLQAQRSSSFSATWSINFRSGFRSQTSNSIYKNWIGHDLIFDWTDPSDPEGFRVKAGILNITDKSLSVDLSEPSAGDEPAEAGWGRTIFLSVSKEF